MMKHKQIIKNITAKLKTIDIEKAILFGSCASGHSSDDSDIDLYIVTNDDYVPINFAEKSAVYLKISEGLDEFSTETSVDLIVHTRPMHQKFVENQSMFSLDMLKNGKHLL
jgi:uncharacterized protein